MTPPTSLSPPSSLPSRRHGFSVLELLVAMSVLALILVMVVEMLEATQRSLSQAQRKTSQFREAEVAFEAVSRHVSQATLQTFLAYDNPTNPNAFVRESQLHFISGEAEDLLGSSRPSGAGETPTHGVFFQGPFGYTLTGQVAAGSVDTDGFDNPDDVEGAVMNCWGYFIEFGSDKFWRPGFMESGTNMPPERQRFRLMEFRAPAEYSLIFKPAPRLGPQGASNELPYIFNLTSRSADDYRFWFNAVELGGVNHPDNYSTTVPDDSFRSVRMVAENIVALIVRPKTGQATLSLSEATASEDQLLFDGYNYDSRYWQWTSGGDHTANVSIEAENTKNVLPPVIEIAMVAIDEASASRFVAARGENALADVIPTNLFNSPIAMDEDLETLGMTLQDNNLAHRTFRTSVVVRESNWSEIFRN